MVDRHSVIEYLNKHPTHSIRQMRVHFVQTVRQIDRQHPVSIGSISNQLNYILRDLEATGHLPARSESPKIFNNLHYSEIAE